MSSVGSGLVAEARIDCLVYGLMCECCLCNRKRASRYKCRAAHDQNFAGKYGSTGVFLRWPEGLRFACAVVVRWRALRFRCVSACGVDENRGPRSPNSCTPL